MSEYGEDQPGFVRMEKNSLPSSILSSMFKHILQQPETPDTAIWSQYHLLAIDFGQEPDKGGNINALTGIGLIAAIGACTVKTAQDAAQWLGCVLDAFGRDVVISATSKKPTPGGYRYNALVSMDLPFDFDIASGIVWNVNSSGFEVAVVNGQGCVYHDYEHADMSGFWDVIRVSYGSAYDFEALLQSVQFVIENPKLMKLPKSD